MSCTKWKGGTKKMKEWVISGKDTFPQGKAGVLAGRLRISVDQEIAD